MSEGELIERLTALIKVQAEIIREQAEALEQMGAVVENEERAKAAARERAAITGEGRESGPLFAEVKANDAE